MIGHLYGGTNQEDLLSSTGSYTDSNASTSSINDISNNNRHNDKSSISNEEVNSNNGKKSQKSNKMSKKRKKYRDTLGYSWILMSEDDAMNSAKAFDATLLNRVY
jgi:hypothetical protein